jgi:hypothetical protein
MHWQLLKTYRCLQYKFREKKKNFCYKCMAGVHKFFRNLEATPKFWVREE